MNPESLFRAWDGVEKRLRAARRLALILDFDGTLAPIKSRPALVNVADESRALLRRIVKLPRVYLWIVSGRRAGDLRKRLRVSSVRILGVYGWRLPARLEARVDRAYRAAKAALKNLPGVWLENKTACFTVHYREAAIGDARRARRLLHAALPSGMEILRRKGAWEIVAPGYRDKSEAVKQLLAGYPPDTLAIIAGDDRSDEPSFAAVPSGITIRVGRSRRTAAKYFVRTPSEMWVFLRLIESLYHGERR